MIVMKTKQNKTIDAENLIRGNSSSELCTSQ